MLKNFILVFFVSMVPIAELRVAVPMALNMGLPMIPAYIVCAIGNMLPVPFIYLFARKILIWGSHKKYIGKFFTWCLEKGERGGRKLAKRAGRSNLFLALLLFVGIPIPGTGAWTGTLAASLLDMGLKSTALAVSLGVAMAGVIMYFISAGALSVFSFLL